MAALNMNQRSLFNEIENHMMALQNHIKAQNQQIQSLENEIKSLNEARNIDAFMYEKLKEEKTVTDKLNKKLSERLETVNLEHQNELEAHKKEIREQKKLMKQEEKKWVKLRLESLKQITNLEEKQESLKIQALSKKRRKAIGKRKRDQGVLNQESLKEETLSKKRRKTIGKHKRYQIRSGTIQAIEKLYAVNKAKNSFWAIHEELIKKTKFGYHGVLKGGNGKWVAWRRFPGMKYNGCNHLTKNDAAIASDALWRELGGPLLKLNFPTKEDARRYDEENIQKEE